MSDRSALMELLIDGYPENLKAASGWTGFTVLLGLLPMLLSIVGFLIADQAQGITTLIEPVINFARMSLPGLRA